DAVYWEVDFRYEKLDIGFEESSLNVVRDRHYKYIHFAAMPDLLFDIENDPEELHNLANDPAYSSVMLKYVKKLLSWRMRNDERTLTNMFIGPEGVTVRPRNYK
ncbi:MAG: DUF4976 domain-containing protein, partial [Spirochaetales bacterium]|nr:DUF4976 domain-containing protein [Spirochaetales bacterium]